MGRSGWTRIRLGTHVAWDAPDDELLFLRQLGIRHVRVHVPAQVIAYEEIARIVERFAAARLSIYSIVHLSYQAREIALGLPGREAGIERLATVVGHLGRLGVPVLEYDFFLFAPLPETGGGLTRQ